MSAQVNTGRGGWRWPLLAVLSALLAGGCTSKYFRKSADKEAARIIAQKGAAVPNMDRRFAIEQTNRLALEGLPLKTTGDDFLGTAATNELQVPILNLDQALALAVVHSREYQNQKEMLYLQALSLSLSRHRFTPIFSSGAGATVQNQPQDVAAAVDKVAGTQTALLQQDTTVVQQYNVTGRGSVGASVLLRSGARLASSFTIDFLRFLNGDPRFAVRSSLGATLTQPLLRGAGYKVTMENLTQAERDMLYALRDFTVFRKDFSVRVAQAYYGVLQSRDAACNYWIGYQNYQQNLRRQRALAEEGRESQARLGLLEQEGLRAEASWISGIRAYRERLDQFKILLGLPTETALVLDDADLGGLKIEHPELSPEDALAVAMATRLDLQTARERREDAGRKVKIAANALKPQVDMVISGNVDSKTSGNNPANLDFDRARGSAGLDIDLGLDRKAERNSYREALISSERAIRSAQLQEDQVKLQIYAAWRALDEARRRHENSLVSLKLAERRVEEQRLLLELGRTTSREVVDAQTALVSSLNDRTSTMVDHTIARLQFWRDMGILYIKDNGKWEEITHDAKR